MSSQSTSLGAGRKGSRRYACRHGDDEWRRQSLALGEQPRPGARHAGGSQVEGVGHVRDRLQAEIIRRRGATKDEAFELRARLQRHRRARVQQASLAAPADHLARHQSVQRAVPGECSTWRRQAEGVRLHRPLPRSAQHAPIGGRERHLQRRATGPGPPGIAGMLDGDEDGGTAGQRQGDHRALAHATAELEGVAVHLRRRARDLDLAQQVFRATSRPARPASRPSSPIGAACGRVADAQ